MLSCQDVKFGLYPEWWLFSSNIRKSRLSCGNKCDSWSLITLCDWKRRQASSVLYLCLRCVEVCKLARSRQYRASWSRCSVSWWFHLFSEGEEELVKDSSLMLYSFTDRIGNCMELAKGKTCLGISWLWKGTPQHSLHHSKPKPVYNLNVA